MYMCPSKCPWALGIYGPNIRDGCLCGEANIHGDPQKFQQLGRWALIWEIHDGHIRVPPELLRYIHVVQPYEGFGNLVDALVTVLT